MVLGVDYEKVGSKEVNKLIFADDIQSAYFSGLTFYDTDFFEYVSGSQRTAAGSATNITLKAKFSGIVTVFWAISSACKLIINGTQLSLENGKCNEVTINKGDTVNLNFPVYYNCMLMFYNCDRSTWQGGVVG